MLLLGKYEWRARARARVRNAVYVIHGSIKSQILYKYLNKIEYVVFKY